MRIAVVTPYYREPLEKLLRCHASVVGQTYANVTHIMVADGYPRPEITDWARCQHIPLPFGHQDSGDTPRIIGCSSAASQQFDAIALLDADNWFEPEHLETLVKVQAESGALIVTSLRRLVRPDTGESLGVCTESDGIRFTDTNCYLVTHPAFPLLSAWGLRNKQTAQSIGCLGDRLFWDAVSKSNVRRAHARRATVNYETAFAAHYHALGLSLPEFAKVNVWLPSENRYRLVSYPEYRNLVEKGLATSQGY